MARRRRSNRRRRGRFSFLYKLLSTLAICGAIILALTLFFRVNTVAVSGQQRYTAQEIQDATGVQSGDNLFLLNKYDVVKNMLSALPYLEHISISRKLPDTLLIQVEECGEPLAVVQEGSAWLISPSGKIVEQRTASDASGYGVIDGCQLLAPSVGTQMALATEYAGQQSSLISLMTALDAAGMLEKVDAIHLKDLSTLSMDYDGRFTVQLAYGVDYAQKLRALRQILEESGAIQDNMTGTFDMRSDDGKVNLIQNVR
jgi:cell division protein FtsQ